MKKVYCSVAEHDADPLFEVFDGGDLILSSYHDIESDKTEVCVYVDDESRVGEAVSCLGDALSLAGLAADIAVSDVREEDWKFSYRRHFSIEPVGKRLLIVPAWEVEAAESMSQYAGRIRLVLDPGLAFGTGKHETTKACLEFVDGLSESQSQNKTETFLDMGCGSGILSIAAAKLGFTNVAGFDIDEDAVRAAQENAALNGAKIRYEHFALGGGGVTLDESIEAAKGLYPDIALQGMPKTNQTAKFEPADLVVANILGPLLIAFSGEIATYVKRRLVISGILNEIYDDVVDAFAGLGLKEVERKTIGEWSTGLLVR